MLLFGTAGVPLSSPGRDTISGIKRIKELNLECMEIEFVRGVKMGEKTAAEVRKVASDLGIELSVHAPYYVNLNSEEKGEASKKRVFDSARIGSLCGARSIVFHPGYYLKSSPENAYKRIKRRIGEIVEALEQENIDVILRPETTGKKTQFGTLEEVLNLSLELERVLPCIDFAHMYAKTRGALNSYEQFYQVLEKIESALGKEGIKNMHIHMSGIEYGKGGERDHRILRESAFKYADVLRALKDYNVSGVVICESPNLEEDAFLLKETYNSLHK